MIPVLLILFSACLHAAWNLVVRRHGRTQPATALMVAGAVLLTFPLGLAFSPADWRHALGWGICAGLGEAAYFFTLAHALEIGPLAAVYTVSRGSSMLLVWPISHLLLGEPLGWRAFTAVAVLMLGLALLAPSDDRRGTTSAGYAWALACGLCIAGFQIIYKGAVSDGAEPPLIFLFSMATSLPFVIWSAGPAARQSLELAWAEGPGWIAFGALAMTCSFLIVLYVLRSRGAGWVMTLRNSSVAFAQLFGWIGLHERPTIRGALGVALVLADSLLLGSG